MKLFLSSVAITPAQGIVFAALVGKKPKDIRLGLIENAADVYGKDATAWVDENRAAIQSCGYDVEIINLNKYKKDRFGLAEKLASKDAIWLGGGNTYYLRWLLKKTGADIIITKLVEQGKVYGGGSAGAIVAGPTLNFFQAADDPQKAPELMLDGLRLIDLVVVPHADNPKYGKIMKKAETQLRKSGYKTVIIDDAQAIVVDGTQPRLLKD